MGVWCCRHAVVTTDEQAREKAKLALLAAASGEDADRVRRLLAADFADVNATSLVGWTALHHAALDGSISVLQVLLDAHGVDTDAQDAQGRTALHIACLKHHVTKARLLIRAGADPTLRDFKRCTAAELVRKPDAFKEEVQLYQAAVQSRWGRRRPLLRSMATGPSSKAASSTGALKAGTAGGGGGGGGVHAAAADATAVRCEGSQPLASPRVAAVVAVLEPLCAPSRGDATQAASSAAASSTTATVLGFL